MKTYADGRRDERLDRLRARRARRATGKDKATYPMLINVMQHLTEWGFDKPLYKVHWEDNLLMLMHHPSAFTAEQLDQLRYQQCTPVDEALLGFDDCLVMHFNEDDD